MGARGLDPRVLLTRTTRDPDLAAGRAAAAEARHRWPDADAFLCFNDAAATGVVKGLIEQGVSVPDDVAVVGIDGLALGSVLTPELSTLRFDFQEVAEIAVELVVDIAAGRLPRRGEKVQRVVRPQLRVRGSS